MIESYTYGTNQRGWGRSWIHVIIFFFFPHLRVPIIVFLLGSACCPRSQLLAQVQKCGLNELTPPGWPGRSLPCWGYSRNIEFWGSFEAQSYISIIFHTIFKINLLRALFFSFHTTPWLKPWNNWYMRKFDFRNNFSVDYFLWFSESFFSSLQFLK